MSDKAVNLESVTVFQSDGRQVLSDVNLEISQGEFVYFVGKTGTGKTSLLKTLYADLPLLEGEGSIADVTLLNLESKKIPGLRRKIGIVFQDFQLLDDRTVFDNLIFVLRATNWDSKDKMKSRSLEVLQMVEMEWAMDKMPHELSGGEQQRIVLARALLNKPSVIIADEPTGNLDPDTSDDIMKLIHDVAQDENTTVIMATHDYRLINKFPGTVYRTANGSLLPEGMF
jgi:cell division transport system ATP-binding protein